MWTWTSFLLLYCTWLGMSWSYTLRRLGRGLHNQRPKTRGLSLLHRMGSGLFGARVCPMGRLLLRWECDSVFVQGSLTLTRSSPFQYAFGELGIVPR
ncbi:uncharacterized protein BO66DRAFT_122296 [Aspergillus aculeatinus CBS 121060]|uniref:Uncharacterized protein n=1 Tax=Aspergillus aculeatinus CBS 121060 TaxID=1448322 RepID=A0ACD1H5L1_9EURO|nr:hypothetical protein BO66DRAFT_122296 [Aspergillus aculeatinus CBS 121060]RAH68873.1 hypothetical protein BO66DRAFT_122296 [Aspergillus aculeatinus CBS 121060]